MLPPELSFDAGTLAEPLACVLHAQELAALASHHCAVVFGCGAFGLLHIQAALSISVGRILAVDKVESRIRSAISLGASGALTSDDLAGKVRTINNGQLADVAIIATGDPNALTLASDILTRHGTILLFGAPDPKELLSLSLNKLFWRRELTIVSSYGAGDVAFSPATRLAEARSGRQRPHHYSPRPSVGSAAAHLILPHAHLNPSRSFWTPRNDRAAAHCVDGN